MSGCGGSRQSKGWLNVSGGETWTPNGQGPLDTVGKAKVSDLARKKKFGLRAGKGPVRRCSDPEIHDEHSWKEQLKRRWCPGRKRKLKVDDNNA